MARKTRKTRKTLPNKPSKLITLALDDLNEVEKDNRYKVDMRSWHDPNSHCSVCLAGAVMAKSLGADPERFSTPFHFPDLEGKLTALNRFRHGAVDDGMFLMGLSKKNAAQHAVVHAKHKVPSYQRDRRGFKLALRALARKLAKVGL